MAIGESRERLLIADLMAFAGKADDILTHGTRGASWADVRGQYLATIKEARAYLAEPLNKEG